MPLPVQNVAAVCCDPESCLVVVPDKCTVEAAAQAFVNHVTAYGFFDVLQVTPRFSDMPPSNS